MTATDIISSGERSFAPRARLVSVLGEQLIRDARVGLLELVKNAYDADASKVTVELLGLASAETTEIIITDDGEGMDKETVLGRWLEPATGHKEEAKKAGVRTPKFKRLPLGEKGVGRFAAHRLGRQLELITRKEGQPEVVVRINWDDFEQGNPYLHEVPVKWEERTPIVFTGDKTGTRMIMRVAREVWKEEDVRSVSEGLRRLMNPFKPVNDFDVRLVCPDFARYEDLDPGDLLTRAHAIFEGLVDENGIMEADYTFRLPGYRPRHLSFSKEDLRLTIKDWKPPDLKPECGGFYFRFYLWHRAAASLSQTGINDPKELDRQCGVNIFRDGIRVLPYGEPDDDWLSLDERRYLKPAKMIGRKTILAAIEITQSGNPDLRDKTNREGLIENQAFLDLRELVLALVVFLENVWYEDRALIENIRKEKQQTAARPALENFKAELQELETQTDLTHAAIDKISRALEKGKVDPSAVAELSSAIAQLRASIPIVKTVASDSQEKLEEVVQDLEDQRDLLLGLAGMGLAAERFTHEFSRLTREASDLIKHLRRNNHTEKVQADLDALSAIIDALRNDIKALGPMFYVRRATREKELSIRAAIANAELLNKSAFADARVDFEVIGDDFTVIMREGPLTQVFNNLFDNAAFWLSRKSDETDRKLRVVIDAPRRQVLVTDNGPGINPRYYERIFQPFFSTKTDGRGLGLYIVREIMAAKKFGVRLLDADEQMEGKFRMGASFLLSFYELTDEDEHDA